MLCVNWRLSVQFETLGKRFLKGTFLLFFLACKNSSVLSSQDTVEDLSRSKTRPLFIITQAEWLQNLLALSPEKQEGSMLFFKEPFSFLNREGSHLSILDKESGDKELMKAFDALKNLEKKSSDKKGHHLFYFQILFHNALGEQKEDLKYPQYEWHQTIRRSLWTLTY